MNKKTSLNYQRNLDRYCMEVLHNYIDDFWLSLNILLREYPENSKNSSDDDDDGEENTLEKYEPEYMNNEDIEMEFPRSSKILPRRYFTIANSVDLEFLEYTLAGINDLRISIKKCSDREKQRITKEIHMHLAMINSDDGDIQYCGAYISSFGTRSHCSLKQNTKNRYKSTPKIYFINFSYEYSHLFSLFRFRIS